MTELVIVPPHLIERITRILESDIDLPSDLRSELEAGLERPSPSESERDGNDEQAPRIDTSLLERLSRWATSEDVSARLKTRSLDPSEYGMISLLAGTEVYIPASQLAHLPTPEISPYLPSYLSPLPPSFGQEYRSLARQLSTVLNVLFSIFGSAFAVYVAATTGGGYSREKGILLGVLAGVVVGIADGVLVWIFQRRVKEGREEGRKMAIKLSKGSGGDDKEENDTDGGANAESDPAVAEGQDVTSAKKEIRLRRRAISDKKEL